MNCWKLSNSEGRRPRTTVEGLIGKLATNMTTNQVGEGGDSHQLVLTMTQVEAWWAS